MFLVILVLSSSNAWARLSGRVYHIDMVSAWLCLHWALLIVAQAFLGPDEAQEFVTWLWDLLASVENKTLDLSGEAATPAEVAEPLREDVRSGSPPRREDRRRSRSRSRDRNRGPRSRSRDRNDRRREGDSAQALCFRVRQDGLGHNLRVEGLKVRVPGAGLGRARDGALPSLSPVSFDAFVLLRIALGDRGDRRGQQEFRRRDGYDQRDWDRERERGYGRGSEGDRGTGQLDERRLLRAVRRRVAYARRVCVALLTCSWMCLSVPPKGASSCF